MEIENKHTNWLAFVLIIVFFLIVASLLGYLFVNRNKGEGNILKNLPFTKKTVVSSSVEITKDSFVPATIQIKKGTQVIWTNNDTAPHRLVTDPHPLHNKLKELDSGTLAKGESFTVTFEKTGTFTYHDEGNPLNMKGSVIVK